MHIQDREIRRIVDDEKEYRYGRFIDIRSQLERMTISLDENNGCYRVNARIAQENERFIVSIKISHNGDIIQATCSCGMHGHCRHIATILFYLRKLDVQSFPYFYEMNNEASKAKKLEEIERQRKERILSKKQQESLDLITLYKDQLLRESLIPLSSKQYRVKVFVQRKKDMLLMVLKVMNDEQGYVVKNIETFLNAIVHHDSIKYGKNFEFIHSEDAFDDDSLDIIAFVRKCFLKNQLLQNGVIRALIMSDEHLDEFYHLMNNLPSSYCDIAFDKKEYRIPLEITTQDKNYVLDFKDYQEFDQVMMTSHGMYTLQDDILYQYDFHEPTKVMTFIRKLLETRGGLYVPKESLMDFYKYILVDLMDDIELKTTLFDDYRQENLINLYGDMTSDDQICIQLEYIYDDGIAYGFDENNVHKSKEADLIEDYLRPYIEDIEDHVIYLQYDHEFAYQFMKEGLPYLSTYCQIYVTDALKGLSQSQAMHIQVGVHINHGLLSMNIESVDVQKEELMDILKAYKKKRKFYKLKNGKIVSLENKEFKELDELTSTLQLKSQDIVNGVVEIPAYRLFELDQFMNQESSIQYSRSEEFKKWTNELVESPRSFDIPDQYTDILREYQVDGYQWLRLMEHYGFGGILADDMGLGKTLQMIVYLESVKSQGTHMVVTPASLLLNWQDEIEKFAAHMKVLCIYGQRPVREKLIAQISDYDVVITSYDYLRRDIELYDNIEFHTVVIDEAQYIKNPKTRNAMSVKKLKAKQRFALTGTPIENSLAELWSIFDFLMPHYLYHYAYFLDNFERPIVKEHDEDKQEKLKQMISPFVLRRNKKDVLKELPDKIEQTLYLRFNEDEEKLYLANLVQVNKSLQEKLNMNQLGRIDILAMLTRLRQLCQDSRLLYDITEEPSSKLKGCMELIHSLEENHKKILLFSSFTSVLHLIEDQCHKEHISYYLLDGSTPKEKRKEMVDQFQKDDTTLFLISLKAGGSGLNLTSAQAVIHFDPWWNMSAKNQATDRAHRIGQKESVQVFSLIMKDSIEEKIMELQKQKKNLADTFVEGNHGEISTMSIDDMKALFEIS
ncbi:SNF2-related protein [Longibaculum muris]|uniref:SNF2-related protein n=1 Tax=Longibaculum muris TaxID=1796628 RepID=UPI0012B8479A|nr:DEAD/DEAH box helicase [Longibaculum muris]